MPKPLRIIIPIVLILIVAIVIWRVNAGSSREPGVIDLAGNIEATTAELSFQAPGLLLERYLDEGDSVAAGQIVARLDARELVHNVELKRAQVGIAEAVLAELRAGTRPERISQAGAQVSQARARLAELEAGSREQELAQAEAGVAQAQADLARAVAEVELRAAELERTRQLYAAGVYPEQQLDTAQTAYEVAARSRDAAQTRVVGAQELLSLVADGPRFEQVDQARAALQAAGAAYQEVANGPRAETIEQAEAQVTLAREALALAETQLSYADLTAPAPGIVLSKAAEPGEYVRPGTPILGMANLDEVWLRAYLAESDLGRVRLGQSVEVTTDSYADRAYSGTLSYISSEAEFTPKTVQTSEERIKLVYRIKITIPNPAGELKPGMPADARIVVEGAE